MTSVKDGWRLFQSFTTNSFYECDDCKNFNINERKNDDICAPENERWWFTLSLCKSCIDINTRVKKAADPKYHANGAAITGHGAGRAGFVGIRHPQQWRLCDTVNMNPLHACGDCREFAYALYQNKQKTLVYEKERFWLTISWCEPCYQSNIDYKATLNHHEGGRMIPGFEERPKSPFVVTGYRNKKHSETALIPAGIGGAKAFGLDARVGAGSKPVVAAEKVAFDDFDEDTRFAHGLDERLGAGSKQSGRGVNGDNEYPYKTPTSRFTNVRSESRSGRSRGSSSASSVVDEDLDLVREGVQYTKTPAAGILPGLKYIYAPKPAEKRRAPLGSQLGPVPKQPRFTPLLID